MKKLKCYKYRVPIFHSYHPWRKIPQLLWVIVEGVGPKLQGPTVSTTRSVHGSEMTHVNFVHSFCLRRTVRNLRLGPFMRPGQAKKITSCRCICKAKENSLSGRVYKCCSPVPFKRQEMVICIISHSRAREIREQCT